MSVVILGSFRLCQREEYWWIKTFIGVSSDNEIVLVGDRLDWTETQSQSRTVYRVPGS